MRISTRGRYGLRAMFELARGFGEAPVLMSTIAVSQGLSRKHLHTLLTSLKSAGLVRSVRGPGGGFVLSRPPDRIRLSEVLHALEGPLSLVHCVADRRACERSNGCPARDVWQRLSKAIESMLDSVTLKDLVSAEPQACSKPRGKQKGRRSRRGGDLPVERSGVTSRRPRTKADNK
jgi:Rrf2 family cysteine metabolism transcriptional repressor